ncbi:MAG: conserved rane protein of unknown function [Jatrophihabitantaceae bacterium]|nr:conserved rane protein of unknown function [Jatrophihabitantaceae bacterium]
MTLPPPRETPPSWVDSMVTKASGAVGGPWGKRAVRPLQSFWTPVRVLLALATLTLLLGFGEKYPCSDGQWSGHKQYTHACYSDVVPLWGVERLSDGAVPYRDHAVEYPVLTGGFMWASAELTRGWQSMAESGWLPVASDLSIFSLITCIGLAIFGLLTVRAIAGAAGHRPYDAAIVALSPLLVFHAFSNWDLIAMAMSACGLWAWARNRPMLAGVLIGLGAAAKLYPSILLLALMILAVRTAIVRPAVLAIVGAAASWLLVNLPIALTWTEGWKEFYTFSQERSAEASTVWYIGNYLESFGLGSGVPEAVYPNTEVAVAVAAAMGAVVVLGLKAPTKPRLAQLVFLCAFAFLITTKVWSPQFSLWLVPLLALARPRWRGALLWQASEIAVWILTLLWLIGYDDPNRAITYPWLMGALILRDAILFVLAGLIVREMWRPELDVVRIGGVDDPGGGPFDGAPDRWRLGGRRDADADDVIDGNGPRLESAAFEGATSGGAGSGGPGLEAGTETIAGRPA